MNALYNEIDPFCCAWLSNLMDAGLITPGKIDDRPIQELQPDDVAGYRRVHFFAGIGCWDYALNLANWGEREVWTGSCPCQPLSGAGQRKGHEDQRHLWPAFHRLISECKPPIVLGEQVAGKDGREWFSAVRADLEASGYACGGADLCAAGVGAPHIRQRLYWLADADDQGSQGRLQSGRERSAERAAGPGGVAGGLADAAGGSDTDQRERHEPEIEGRASIEFGTVDGTGGRDGGWNGATRTGAGGTFGGGTDGFDRRVDRPGPPDGFWSDADWLLCRDGKWRPAEPGTFPLASGVAARVGRLRGYGNAIVAPLAQKFIEAVMDLSRREAAE